MVRTRFLFTVKDGFGNLDYLRIDEHGETTFQSASGTPLALCNQFEKTPELEFRLETVTTAPGALSILQKYAKDKKSEITPV